MEKKILEVSVSESGSVITHAQAEPGSGCAACCCVGCATCTNG